MLAVQGLAHDWQIPGESQWYREGELLCPVSVVQGGRTTMSCLSGTGLGGRTLMTYISGTGTEIFNGQTMSRSGKVTREEKVSEISSLFLPAHLFTIKSSVFSLHGYHVIHSGNSSINFRLDSLRETLKKQLKGKPSITK